MRAHFSLETLLSDSAVCLLRFNSDHINVCFIKYFHPLGELPEESLFFLNSFRLHCHDHRLSLVDFGSDGLFCTTLIYYCFLYVFLFNKKPLKIGWFLSHWAHELLFYVEYDVLHYSR